MENTALCIICGVDMFPRTGVFWYRPSANTCELVFAPHLWPRAHRANGMHWCCFDAHKSVLRKCDAGKEPHGTADCCHDRSVHSKRVEEVRKKPDESWTTYFARCEPSSRWDADSHERLRAIVIARNGESS
jgi:hypothetical protein